VAAPGDGGQQADLHWSTPLFPFQQAGVEQLVSRRNMLLADEMGLGKTIQTIAALRLLKARKQLKAALVVAPAGLVLQWRRQFRDWAPELRLSTAVGEAGDRGRAWHTPADVFLVGYESLRSDLWLKGDWAPGVRLYDVVVADEAQRLKNPDSELSRAVKRLHRSRTWALTGTPLENRLDDLLSILEFVVPGGFDPRQKAAGLRRLLDEVQLRRRRRDVLPDLPPKYSATVFLELGDEQRSAYRRAETEGLMRLHALGHDLRITHVLELILRLKQICNFSPESGRSTKLADLRGRLESVTAAGEKALVFSQFVDEPFGARRIARELGEFRPLLYSGGLDAAARTAVIAEFDRDPRRHVLILSLKAGGVGLNLTCASHVFHFDRWWNPAVEAQAEDRVHRIGQARDVHVQNYIVADSIEERIQTILIEKRALFDDVIDGVDAGTLRRLDLDTLMGALRIA
jgi:SNF2 family DNA or RNA helicase